MYALAWYVDTMPCIQLNIQSIAEELNCVAEEDNKLTTRLLLQWRLRQNYIVLQSSLGTKVNAVQKECSIIHLFKAILNQ